jgi:hypothetical protein
MLTATLEPCRNADDVGAPQLTRCRHPRALTWRVSYPDEDAVLAVKEPSLAPYAATSLSLWPQVLNQDSREIFSQA